MFVVTPECLVGLLFCPRMLDNEAILITGAERYCEYTGYGLTFQFHDDFVDDQKLFDLHLAMI